MQFVQNPNSFKGSIIKIYHTNKLKFKLTDWTIKFKYDS